MPQIKKAAYDLVVKKLEEERDSVLYKIRRNRTEFQRLATEQATLKRQVGILLQTLRDVRGESAKVNREVKK